MPNGKRSINSSTDSLRSWDQVENFVERLHKDDYADFWLVIIHNFTLVARKQFDKIEDEIDNKRVCNEIIHRISSSLVTAKLGDADLNSMQLVEFIIRLVSRSHSINRASLQCFSGNFY
jgi:hypothetical protein